METGKVGNAVYDGYTSCPLFTGYGSVSTSSLTLGRGSEVKRKAGPWSEGSKDPGADQQSGVSRYIAISQTVGRPAEVCDAQEASFASSVFKSGSLQCLANNSRLSSGQGKSSKATNLLMAEEAQAKASTGVSQFRVSHFSAGVLDSKESPLFNEFRLCFGDSYVGLSSHHCRRSCRRRRYCIFISWLAAANASPIRTDRPPLAHARRIQIWRPTGGNIWRAGRPANPASTVLPPRQGCLPVRLLQAHGQGRVVRAQGAGAARFPGVRWMCWGNGENRVVCCTLDPISSMIYGPTRVLEGFLPSRLSRANHHAPSTRHFLRQSPGRGL
jgi:hypothetical protein